MDLFRRVAEVAEVLHRVERGLLCRERGVHAALDRLAGSVVQVDRETLEDKLIRVIWVDWGWLQVVEGGGRRESALTSCCVTKPALRR